MMLTTGRGAVTRQLAHPFDIGKDLVPKEAPKFDYSTHEFVVLQPNKFPVEGVHARANKIRGLALKCGDCPGRGIGHDALYVAFH